MSVPVRIAIARAYDDRAGADRGRWVLVDRLWPRGVSKVAAPWDEWCKDVAPSAELRRWFGHDVGRYESFARRYRVELGLPQGARAVTHLRSLASREPLTLVTATRDVEHSGAEVLRRVLVELTEAGA